MNTYFASPERSSSDELKTSIEYINSNPVINSLLVSVSGLIAVLNRDRQILAYNSTFLDIMGIDQSENILGLRVGEAVCCKFSEEEEAGCGTSKYCSTCGLAIALVSSITNNRTEEKICALKIDKDGKERDMVLKVRSHPLDLEDHNFILLFIQDVTKEQQNAILNKTFFHDMKNILNGLVGTTELLRTGLDDELLLKVIHESSMLLNREIEMQSYLMNEKNNTYNLEMSRFSVDKIIDLLIGLFSNNKLVGNRIIEFDNRLNDNEVYTDLALLLRVLTNMITNALEAIDDEKTVLITIDKSEEHVSFIVENPGIITEEIALRIFQRNFSTKEGDGRGIGTFSMKLLGEKLLKGEVTFRCNREKNSTEFILKLPTKEKVFKL